LNIFDSRAIYFSSSDIGISRHAFRLLNRLLRRLRLVSVFNISRHYYFDILFFENIDCFPSGREIRRCRFSLSSRRRLREVAFTHAALPPSAPARLRAISSAMFLPFLLSPAAAAFDAFSAAFHITPSALLRFAVFAMSLPFLYMAPERAFLRRH